MVLWYYSGICRRTMQVTVHYTGGETGTFEAESLKTVNDIAYIDGVMQTGVEDVEVSA